MSAVRERVPLAAASARRPAPPVAQPFPALRVTPVAGRGLQAKLTVSTPGDIWEREADHVADEVLRMKLDDAPRAAPDGRIQRACGGCGAEQDDDDALLQTSRNPGRSPQVTPDLAAGVRALEGRGEPLPAGERSFFEPRFGADFSAVRLHRGERAADTARSLDARAYTRGKDVVMGAGAPAPGTPEGRHLMAHELTHVVQQDGAARGGGAPPAIQRNGDGEETPDERAKLRKASFKKGHDPEASRDRKRQRESELRHERREGDARLRRPGLLERLRDNTAAEIKEAAGEATDTAIFEDYLDQIRVEHGLESIRLEGLGTPQAKVVFKINPTYEVTLSSTGEQLALRARGKDATSKFQTNWKLDPSTLTIPTTPPLTTVVGSEMQAYPLSQDAEQGSEASEDSAQGPMMATLRGHGNKKLPNPNKYIKGHLLNDNLGGPAIPANLFPITAEANAKHLAWVEKFVKSDVVAGYVMAYGVKVEPKPSTITPVYVGNPAPEPGYQVDAAFKCESYRLDQAGQPIAASKASIDITSVYGNKLKGSFDVRSYASYQGRYDKIDEGKRTPTAQSVYPNEATFKYPGYDPTQQNLGKLSALSYSTVASFTPPGPSLFFGSPPPSTPSVTIDASQVPAAKLSLQSTPEATLVDTWEKVAVGWSKTDITAWIQAVKAAKPRRWNLVKGDALAHKLPLAVADELFDDARALGRDVMKLG